MELSWGVGGLLGPIPTAKIGAAAHATTAGERSASLLRLPAMRDLLGWNISLGRWSGIRVRLHVFFLLLAIFALHLGRQNGMLLYAVAAIGVLLASAIAHEIGHCVAARRRGGSVDQVIVWPLGGLAHVNLSYDPAEERITAAAGPLVNAMICVISAVALTAMREDVVPFLNPLVPPAPVGDGLTAADALQLAFWVNWLLLVVNLVPAYPLDGGRLLRAVLWPKFGYRTSVIRVAQLARLTAVALWIAAFLLRDIYPFAMLPLALLGVFLFFSAKQEVERLKDRETDDALFGYDFSQGYTSLERSFEEPKQKPPSGPVRQWIESRREARAERQQQIEKDEDRRVDEVLARLHEYGRDALSDEDRALLDRVSARYRNRERE
jgi:Zn-dependent protease